MSESTTTKREHFPFIETAVGGLHNRNQIEVLEEFAPNGHVDSFRSMLRFPKAFPAYVEYNGGSVKDYEGESKADFFPADFDHEEDPDVALEDLRRSIRRWEALYGLPPEALRIFYSGSKGFHLEVPEELFGGLEPGRDTAARLKAAARELLGESETADFAIYETVRLWRAPNTRHRKTKRYKIPLYAQEVFSLSIAEIRELAKKPRDGFVHTDPGEFEPVPELRRIWEHAREQLAAGGKYERLVTAEILDGVPYGERDTKLFKLACKFRGAGIPQDAAEHLLVEAAAKCDPPFPKTEALEKVANAYDKYPEGGTVLFSSFHSPLGVSSDDENKNEDSEIVWFAQLGEPKERRYLIEKIGTKGYPIVAFGAGGVAKSFAMLAAGIAIAGDAPGEWLGLKILEHGHVLYLDFELDVEEQHRRVRDLCRGLGVEVPERLAYLSGVGLTSEAAFKKAYAFVREYGAKAVIIDSMGLAMEGDMERGKDVLAFHSRYINPLRRVGATPFVVDHEGKKQAGEKHKDKSPFGSAYKAWAARSVLQFQLDEYDRENSALNIRVRQTKTNFGPMLEPFGVKFTFEEKKVSIGTYDLPDTELVEEESAPVGERILGALRVGPATIADLEKTTGAARGTIYNNIAQLIQAGEVREDGYRGRSKVYALFSSSPDTPRESEMMKTKKSPTTLAEFMADPPKWVKDQAAEVIRRGRQKTDIDKLAFAISEHFGGVQDGVLAVVEDLLFEQSRAVPEWVEVGRESER